MPKTSKAQQRCSHTRQLRLRLHCLRFKQATDSPSRSSRRAASMYAGEHTMNSDLHDGDRTANGTGCAGK